MNITNKLDKSNARGIIKEERVVKLSVRIDDEVNKEILPNKADKKFQNNPSTYQLPCDDIDERDKNELLCATEYVEDMYEYFRSKEASAKPNYMESQPHINEKMREILIDWLIDVHYKFKLQPETLYLCVNILDRFLKNTHTQVHREKFQLVGATCLLISSKYEEICALKIYDLVYICDDTFSKYEILDMEETILKALKYKITIPSAHTFLLRFLKAAHADKKMAQISCLILDGTLQKYSLLRYLPSELAAGSVLLARRITGRKPWSPTLKKYAKYCEEDIVPIARAILSERRKTHEQLNAVTNKYRSKRYDAVSNISMPHNI